MNIWFDISNSPHINMFYDLIKELEAEGHKIILTSRPLANTVALLDQRGLKHTTIGEHYGKNIYKKILGYPIRVFQLRRFLKTINPDIAISQSSFHSPLTARLLGIPSIYMNDNEHAMGNIPAFLFATKILVPEFLELSKIKAQGAALSKIIPYAGVKEGIYLWQSYLSQSFRLETSSSQSKKIYIRPEPRSAQYYKGNINFLDEVIIGLKEKYNIIILTRDKDQFSYYCSDKFLGVHIPSSPIMFNEIAKDCLLFIGAGGTMTREMAVIGVPTISIYQDELLAVDKYLIKVGLMRHCPELNLEVTKAYIKENNSQTPNETLLQKGKETYLLIKSLIVQTGSKN